MRLAAVVIPIYKTELDEYEQISLRQSVRVLSAHPLIVIKPYHLDVSAMLKQYPTLEVRAFDDNYFKSVDGYNQLLCSEIFYESFLDFEYMLIAQLDSFVFHDGLRDWCKKGFDYIGAPQFEDIRPPNSTRTGLREWLAFPLRQPLLNGGLSLRKIRACLRLLRVYHRFRIRWNGNEDSFFSLHFPRFLPFRPLISLPQPRQALNFAIEFEPARSLELNGGNLPMGCHAWALYAIDFWRPIFRQYGYQI